MTNYDLKNRELKNRLSHVLNYMEAAYALLERKNNTDLSAAQQILSDGFFLLNTTIGMIDESEKPDEMTIDEKESLCILIETYLHTSICYDLCEQWKDGILRIAQEIKKRSF